MERRSQGKLGRPGARARGTSPAPAGVPSRLPRPILLVEDEPSLREILARVLEQEGYRVLSAANGREALLRARDETPALVITDLMMPVLDGHELLERLDVVLPSVPVVVLSELDRPRLRGRLNVKRIMRKPVTLDALLQVVSTVVSPG